MTPRLPSHRLRAGSPLARWIWVQTRGGLTALLTEQDRAYEVRRVAPNLSQGAGMGKKAGTQVIEALQALTVNEIDGTCTMTVEERDRCVRLLKRVDARDEQRQGLRPRKKVKKAAKKARKAAKKARKVARR